MSITDMEHGLKTNYLSWTWNRSLGTHNFME